MPRKGRKRPDSFTVIIVPHTEHASFSVRIPLWTIYVAVGLIVTGLAGVAFLLLDYQDATAQLAQLRRGGQLGIVHEQQLRNTIVAERQQQDALRSIIADQEAHAAEQANEWSEEAARFNEEVSQLYAQIAELEQFKADIRHIVGLDRVAPTPSATPDASTAKTDAPPTAAPGIGPLEPLQDDRVALNLSSRGGTRSASAQEAIQATSDLLQNAVPQQKADLEALKQQVAERIAKVGKDWSSPEQLNRELSLYDASPRAWPVYGLITAPFGYDARRIALGVQPFHEGIDIGANVGTAVRAPQDGVVVSAGWNGSYGLVLEIRHSMGWSTLYAHLATIPVKVGQSVKKGDIIGYVGMTGLTTGPHLHYEIHLNGTPVDPAKYLGR